MLACSKDPDKDSEYKLLFCKSDRKEKYIDTDSDSCDEIQDSRVDTREIELELSSLLSRLNEKKNEALLLSRKNSELTVEVVRLRKHLSKFQAKYDKIRLRGQNAYYENCEMRKQCEETKLISEEYLRQLTQMKRLVESNIDSGRRIQVNRVIDQSLVKLSRLETASKHQFFGPTLVDDLVANQDSIPKLIPVDVVLKTQSQSYVDGRRELLSLMSYKKGDDVRFAVVSFSVFRTNSRINQIGIEYIGRSGKNYSRVYFIVSDSESQFERDRIQKMKMHCHYDKDVRLIRTSDLSKLIYSVERQVSAYLCYLKEDIGLLMSLNTNKEFPIFSVQLMSCLFYPDMEIVPKLADVVRILSISVLEYFNAGNYASMVAKVYSQIYVRFSECC